MPIEAKLERYSAPVRRLGIVHVITGTDVGGAERLLFNTVEALQEEFDIVILSLCRPGAIGKQMAEAGMKIRDLGMRGFLDIPALLRFYAFLRKQKPDIIHTHLFRANLWGRIIGRLARVPVVISSEHSLTRTHFEGRRRNRVVDKLESLTSRLNDRLIAVSEATRQNQITNGIDSRKISVLPNAICTASFSVKLNRDAIRQQLDVAGNTVITTIGRLHPQKGTRYLLEAFAEVHAFSTSTRLLVVGDGPIRSELETIVARLKLDSCVKFLGNRSDIKEVITASDIVVLPSVWEPFGIVLLEAMAIGRPVVATEVDGIPEIVQHEQTGLLVPARDSLELAKAILRLVTAHEYAKGLAENGRHLARSKYDIKSYANALSMIYREASSRA